LPAPSAAGPWKIQIGAFRDSAAVVEHLRAIERQVPELADLSPLPEARGDVTRARIGGIADRPEAQALCARIANTGNDCFVVAPGG
jgi:cell division septation protein DedD